MIGISKFGKLWIATGDMEDKMKKMQIKIKLSEDFENLPFGEYECELEGVTFKSEVSTDTIFLHLETPHKIKTHKEMMKIISGGQNE